MATLDGQVRRPEGRVVHVEQQSLQAAVATVEGPIMTGCTEAGADLLAVDDLVSLVDRWRKFDWE